jgi:hypothetical protein
MYAVVQADAIHRDPLFPCAAPPHDSLKAVAVALDSDELRSAQPGNPPEEDLLEIAGGFP